MRSWSSENNKVKQAQSDADVKPGGVTLVPLLEFSPRRIFILCQLG